MKIRITQDFAAGNGWGQQFRGTELNVPDSVAKAWVGVGRAEYVDEQPKTFLSKFVKREQSTHKAPERRG